MATAIYARVSTPEQDYQTQESNLWDYCVDELDLDPSEIEVYPDKYTGRVIDRSAFQEMMDDAHAGLIDRVVVRDVTRVGRDFQVIHEAVYEIVDDLELGFHAVNDNIEIEPGEEMALQQKMILSVLAWGAELEANRIRENIEAGVKAAKEQGKWTTKPPYGFTTDEDGYLHATSEYHNAIAAIYAVEQIGWSKRKAARYSGVPRSTLNGILDRQDLYLPTKEYTREGNPVQVTIPEDFGPDELGEQHGALLSEFDVGPVPPETAIQRVVQRSDYNADSLALSVIELVIRGEIVPDPDHEGCFKTAPDATVLG